MVDPAPVVIKKYEQAVEDLGLFMQEKDLSTEPEEVYNLKGNVARIAFIKNFKEVQRIKTELDQYTDLEVQQQEKIEAILPKEKLQEFRSSYLEIARDLRKKGNNGNNNGSNNVDQLDRKSVV